MQTITITRRSVENSIAALQGRGAAEIEAEWIGLLRVFETWTCAGVTPVSVNVDREIWSPIIAATGDAIAFAMGR